ncbi:hypothetical protein C7974DRAFT_276376, partial [Boeremia exigua]|uniref:uncharacterized protein n=1 Tax=Boeremia exigua TaxID=749465 RepID=UPI001E8D61C5
SWSPPSNDITIPSDRQDAIKHVQKVLRAMASTKKAVDSRKDNSFKSRYAKKKMGETVYDPVKMTIRCWDIINLAIDLHNKGPSVLHCFDSQYASNFASTRKWTFQQRIDAIVHLFETRKSRCDVAIKGENLYTVVGNPDKLNRTSIQNGVSNTIKAGEIKRGKEAKQ